MTVVSTDTLLSELRSRSGGDAARVSTDDDVFDGVCPRLLVEPSTADQIAEILGWASSEGLTVSVVGGGTKLTWGAPSGPVDLLLSTTRLRAVIDHRHGDLTTTVESGAPLSAVNKTLTGQRQWLPWDPPWADRATIGGIVATNDSGPRRHGYGSVRDSIIGLTIARIDGAVAKAGGIVVKNVAGYDLSRLLTGSFGCLGVIITATFKLAPLAPASRTVEFALDSLDLSGEVVSDLSTSSLTPTALELASTATSTQLLVRFESVEEAAAQQATEACALLGSRGESRTLSAEEETTRWEQHSTHWSSSIDGTLLKLVCVPAELVSTLVWLRREATSQGVSMSVSGRAGLGIVDVRLDGSFSLQARLIAQLRERLPVGRGSAVIRQGDAKLRQEVGVWGKIGDGMRVMQAVKQRFDPGNLLNVGRGPGGL